jgi:hypothetical protein
MSSFGKPQNFLLHFGQPFAAHLHRKIATRDHHADSSAAQTRHQESGKLSCRRNPT